MILAKVLAKNATLKILKVNLKPNQYHIGGLISGNKLKQAGTELGQAQLKLELYYT